jgi:hypothetical protein
MILHEIMFINKAKMIINTTNLFKQQLLMHPVEILCKICVVECSY